jgi:hypothetical protein
MNSSDYFFSHFAAMLAVLMDNKPKDAQEPPRTEALLRALASLSHWYERHEPSEETAARAVELIRALAYKYDSFWDEFFSTHSLDSPISQAARNATARGIEFKSYEEVSWWLENHRPPDSE